MTYAAAAAVFLFFVIFLQSARASTTNGTIDPSNLGRFLAKIHDGTDNLEINFGKFSTEQSSDITVSDAGLRGFAWGEGLGWFVTNCTDTTSGCSGANGNFKVSISSSGILSGFAWGENAGWINFGPFANNSAPQVKISSNGLFAGTTGSAGYAWSQNFGWITFNCSDPNSCVETDYRPSDDRDTSGGGGGGGGGPDICPNIAGSQSSIPDGLVIDAHGDCVSPQQCSVLNGDLKQPLDIVVAIDRSGSMQGTKMTQAKSAAQTFIDELVPGSDRVAYVSFSSSATLASGLANSYTTTKTKIQSTTASGDTNLGAALKTANQEISANGRAGVKHVIIVLTDGDATVSDMRGQTPDQYAVNQSNVPKANGTIIYSVGLGSDVNTELLGLIATARDNYYQSPTGTDLNSIYLQIAAISCTAAPSNLAGTTIFDQNNNGMIDSDESGFPNATVTLTSKDGSQPTRTLRSDADGNYTFEEVPDGSYTLCFAPPAGMHQTYPASCYNLVVIQGINQLSLNFLASGIVPSDLCPNIAGTQTDIPEGDNIDATGNCIATPPPATCATDPSLCPVEPPPPPPPTFCETNPTSPICTPPEPPTNPPTNPPGNPTSPPGGGTTPPHGNTPGNPSGGSIGEIINNLFHTGLSTLIPQVIQFIDQHAGPIAAVGASGLLAFLLANLYRFWEWLLWLFGFAKRKKKWGTVYDSITKYPLDPAYVTIVDQNGKSVGESITDLDGRYGFLVPPGTYTVKAGKTDYVFPSVRMAGKTSDEVYSDLYFGEQIVIQDDEQIITKNIPMDPIRENWNEAEKRRQHLGKYSNAIRYRKIANALYYIGFAVAFISFALTRSVWDGAMLAIYIILYCTGAIWSTRGSVVKYRGSKRPLAYAIVTLRRASDNGIVMKRTTSEEGRFFALLQNGIYQLTVESRNDDGSYYLAYTSPSFKVHKGVLANDILV